MKYSVTAALFAIIVFTACTDTYKIDGTTSFNDFEGRTLYLKVQDGARQVCVDSCVVRHGHFLFKGSRDSVEMALIYYGEQNLMPVMLDGTNVVVELTETVHRASGSAMNDTLFSFIDRKAMIDQRMSALSGRFSQRIMDGEDIDVVQNETAVESAMLKEEVERLIIRFIKDNINNAMGVGMFTLVTSDMPYPRLTPQVEEIFVEAGSYFRNNAYVRCFNEIAEENMLLLREGKRPERM